MCGISALLQFAKRKRFDLAPLLTMHSALAHRGPDGEGFLLLNDALEARHFDRAPLPGEVQASGNRFAAAFRWLKIQDLSPASCQPHRSVAGHHWILFNGEIYNFRELREELKSLGHSFQTRNDSEVALAAYIEWGTDCFRRFNGMWGILIFDLRKGKLVGSRDRLGIKPLFYSLDDDRLLFASEPKVIAMARAEGPRIEPFRFHEFLCGIPPQSAELSFFRHVDPVPAGNYFEVDLLAPVCPKPEFRPFWTLADFHSGSQPSPSFEAAQETFESLLFASMRDHLVAEVSVGSLLSGGLDSSTLARLMAQNMARDGIALPKTFSVVFEDSEMSEWPYMQLVLAQGGLEGHTLTLTPDKTWNSVRSVVCTQGRPLLGQDTIAQYHAYRLARENETIVVLDGQGADELLAGLPYYEQQIFLEMFGKFQLRRLAQELQFRSRKYHAGLLSMIRAYVWNPIRRQRAESRGLSRYDWMVPAEEAWISTSGGIGKTDDWGHDSSLLNRFLYRLVRHTNLPTVLLQQDHASMSHGVESRVPFLDHRIVEFCFRLPDSYKVRNGDRKKLLLDTARKYLPGAVVNRTDKRMFISKANWMDLRGRHAEELCAMAGSRTMQEIPFLEKKKMIGFVDEYLAGLHDDEQAIWRLYTAWHWMEAFGLS
ncbi:MAG: asparagine synthase (glutamine-hydrolyzing) [Terriglobia bacterium]